MQNTLYQVVSNSDSNAHVPHSGFPSERQKKNCNDKFQAETENFSNLNVKSINTNDLLLPGPAFDEQMFIPDQCFTVDRHPKLHAFTKLKQPPNM